MNLDTSLDTILLSHFHIIDSENQTLIMFTHQCRHKPGQPFFSDGGEGKLLRMVETQLNENDYDIDFERLCQSFQEEDRELRGTLSAEQVRG